MPFILTGTSPYKKMNFLKKSVVPYLTQACEEGILIQQVTSIRSNLLRGKSIESIAEFLDLDIEFVRMLAARIAESASATDAELVEWYGKIKERT